MSEIGTLEELSVKPGDVVQHLFSGCHYTVCTKKFNLIHPDGTSHNYPGWNYGRFNIVSRSVDTPKLWRDMTPEEKGALLLAMHEKKEVQEYHFCAKVWVDHFWNAPIYTERAYRVKPDPKVETVTVPWSVDPQWSENVYNITFNTIDGKPDCTSVKMEEV